jgi:hypothetical protein
VKSSIAIIYILILGYLMILTVVKLIGTSIFQDQCTLMHISYCQFLEVECYIGWQRAAGCPVRGSSGIQTEKSERTPSEINIFAVALNYSWSRCADFETENLVDSP